MYTKNQLFPGFGLENPMDKLLRPSLVSLCDLAWGLANDELWRSVYQLYLSEDGQASSDSYYELQSKLWIPNLNEVWQASLFRYLDIQSKLNRQSLFSLMRPSLRSGLSLQRKYSLFWLILRCKLNASDSFPKDEERECFCKLP